MIIIILSLIIVSALLYLYLSKPYTYWEKRGVKYEKPTILFGNVREFILQRIALYLKLDAIYKEYEGERYCGFFQFRKPILLIRDPELIKTITIKEFDSFANHDVSNSNNIDPYWSKNLFSSTGDQWHSMRSILSPAFTSSKMKMMFNLISDCTKQVAKHFSEQNEKILTLEMKNIFSRVSNDIIATCALGINCDSIKFPDNDVYKHSLDITDFSGIKSLKFLGYSISPTLMKLFRVKVFPTSSTNFFEKLIKEAVNLRLEKKIVRPDMIQLMLKARAELEQERLQSHDEKNKINKNFHMTDEDMTAQALVFLLGGLDTASTLLVFLAYELALNKDIQDKLIKEIDAINGKLTYDALMEMKYLDLVVAEGLRKWPAMSFANRTCTKDYEILPESPKEKSLRIEKGTAVWYSIYSLHRDPKYFKNPERFDPERFNIENKSKIMLNTYIPFGIGPRNCIGSRFTLLEVKAVLFHLLKEFEFVPVEKTKIPAEISKKHVHLAAADGMWLGLKKRV